MKVVLGRTGLGSMVGKEFGNTEVRVRLFHAINPSHPGCIAVSPKHSLMKGYIGLTGIGSTVVCGWVAGSQMKGKVDRVREQLLPLH